MKLTDDCARRICVALRNGCYRRDAIRAGGIDSGTFYRWLERGKSGEEPYAAFAVRVKKAEAAAIPALVGIIKGAARKGQWTAAAWLLERHWAKAWGKKDTTTTTIKAANHKEPNLDNLSTDEMRAYFALRAKAADNENDRIEFAKLAEALA